MKEPERIPLDPSTPRPADVEKIPMPSVYPETMSDDVYSSTKDEGGAEQAFFNFIQKAKESKRRYNERLEKQSKDST
tara:strand:- start:6626 stop:6856 length:231 start_codon:yes stop_codon:yes gene_type:complete